MTKYNKLVRDKIPEIIRQNGDEPVTHIANDDEYREKLFEKLQEEISEFIENTTPEELADILEVIDAIIDEQEYDRGELAELKEKKAKERGGFSERIVLDETK